MWSTDVGVRTAANAPSHLKQKPYLEILRAFNLLLHRGRRDTLDATATDHDANMPGEAGTQMCFYGPDAAGLLGGGRAERTGLSIRRTHGQSHMAAAQTSNMIPNVKTAREMRFNGEAARRAMLKVAGEHLCSCCSSVKPRRCKAAASASAVLLTRFFFFSSALLYVIFNASTDATADPQEKRKKKKKKKKPQRANAPLNPSAALIQAPGSRRA